LTERIVPSIKLSVSYFRTRAEWQTALGALLVRFNSQLREHVVRLVDAFKFQDWVLSIVAEHYSLQELAEGLEVADQAQMHVAKDFYCQALPSDSFAIDVTAPVRERVSRLIHRAPKSPASKILREALRKSLDPDELQGILATIISAIETKGDWRTPLDRLAASFDPGQPTALQTVERRLEPLPEMLRTAPLELKKEIVQFITAAAPKLRKVSFQKSTQVLIEILIGECDWREPIIQCLGKALADVSVMAQCLATLDRAAELAHEATVSIIDALLVYVEEAPPQRLLPIQKAFVRKLALFMIHERPEVRRKAVAIFAQFQRKIPRDFSHHLKKIAITQARLIQLCAQQTKQSL
jgi:hypothetical protein